jgi:hypothetical protein
MTKLCARCEKSFEAKSARIKASKSGLLFCSRQCKDIAQRIGGLTAIQPKHYITGMSYYRQRALREYGPRCTQCGYDEYEKMLDVDHIDGNRGNNTIENLQVLCVWCHALKTRGISARGNTLVLQSNMTGSSPVSSTI